MYRAIVRFADLQDAGRIYEAGEEYPRPGFAVSGERLAELAGSDNRAGKALIRAVEAPVSPADNPSTDKPKRARKATTSRRKG